MPWFFITLLVIGLDQWTKRLADTHLESPVAKELDCRLDDNRRQCFFSRDANTIIIFPGFKLRYAQNFGAAFSFLNDAGGWQTYFFSILAIGVSLLLTFWIVKTALKQDKSRWFELLALSLILGGAIGNVYDRITLGYVIDFIVWHYQASEFPTFNIADSAICTGAGLLIFDMLFLQKKPTKQTVTEP